MTCARCGRRFGGLTGFDKHQSLVFDDVHDTDPRWKSVKCHDPATLLRKDGSPAFRQDARSVWRLTSDRPHPALRGLKP